nr:response regulator [Butyrivibrio sp.]
MNKFQVLVVEDDPPIRKLIATTLKTHDYKYLLAQNGEEALMQASTYCPDVVFLDLGLPDLDGVEVIKRI